MYLFYDETDDAWPEWFAGAGLSGATLPPGPTYPNCEISTTMVEQHQGVSLAYNAMVRSTIASGRLERLRRDHSANVDIRDRVPRGTRG